MIGLYLAQPAERTVRIQKERCFVCGPAWASESVQHGSLSCLDEASDFLHAEGPSIANRRDMDAAVLMLADVVIMDPDHPGMPMERTIADPRHG